MRSKRFEALDARPVNQDGFVSEWPEVGLIAMDSPNDPKPSIKLSDGKVVELDGKTRDQFDMIDTFVADYGINLERAEEPWPSTPSRWPACCATSTCPVTRSSRSPPP